MHAMTAAALAVSVLASTLPVHAGNGIHLNGEKLTGTTMTGTCGPASVKITAVDADNVHKTRRLIDPNGVITIRGAGATLTIGGDADSGVFLQNQNKLQCLATPKGEKLVLALYCFSRNCASVDYRVIDPTRARVVSAKDENDECNAGCAEKALGRKLPDDLGEEL